VGALTPRAKNRFQAFTVDVQGELNLEILEHMDGIEMEDWARGWKGAREVGEISPRRAGTIRREEGPQSTKARFSREDRVFRGFIKMMACCRGRA